ncbi:hypothetical protein [Salinisphaera orenii]|uniref:hypothetical protein n=1 Tax=Salinisphaera orenii TaxID=856731 RepID=UPI000F4A49EC|nr:hypothetical protein [Salinisphaera halophila]
MSTQPTAEQWKALEEGLYGPFGRAELECDGYTLSLCKLQVAENRLAIQVFVDGLYRSEWHHTDCEQRRRFFCPEQHAVYTGQYRKALARMSKRARKDAGIDIDEKWTSYAATWPRFAPLRQHLKRENASIAIASVNGAAAAAAVAFRAEYVRCRQTGERFDPTCMDGWNAR